jgi:multidrug resistance efflux pump
MLIIALIYTALIWVIFFRLKLLRWTWSWRIITVLGGCALIGIFAGLLNTLAPSGRIAVVGRVVEVTPNVAGTVIEIPVEPNVLVRRGTILFEIDPTPFKAKVLQLQAAVAEAQQKVKQLGAQLDLAIADVNGLNSQLIYAEQRRDDIERLARMDAASDFKLQDAAAQASLLEAQVQGAKAREIGARFALGSEIDGENTAVAQLRAQLETAQWELDQTTVRAPSDGYVGTMALAVGARAVPLRSALSFILADDMALVGVFEQNGFKHMKQGTLVKMVFASRPGVVVKTRISDIMRGIGPGQIAVSGTLARTETIGTSTTFPVRLDIPEDFDKESLRLGMVGTATAFSENAGAIGVLADVLLVFKSYAMYL